MLHYLGLGLVLTSWFAGAYLLTKWRSKGLPTISKHGASTPSARLFLGSILAVLGLLFYWWLVAWFAPSLQLGSAFIVLLTITIACQVLAGVFPDTHGWSHRIHGTAAYTMAVLYLPLAVYIICSPLSLPTRLLCIALALYMAITFTILVLLYRGQRRFLTYQVLYIVAFQALILLAGYVG